MGRYTFAAGLLTSLILFLACGSTELSDEIHPIDAGSDVAVEAPLDALDDVPDVVDATTEAVASCDACMALTYTCTTPVQLRSATMVVSNPTIDSCTFELPGTKYSFDCSSGEVCRLDGDATVCAPSTFDGQVLSFDHFGNTITCYTD